MRGSKRRNFGGGQVHPLTPPEHHAADVRLTHLTAAIHTHEIELPTSSADCGHVRPISSSHTGISAVEPLHLHRPNPTPCSRCWRQKGPSHQRTTTQVEVTYLRHIGGAFGVVFCHHPPARSHNGCRTVNFAPRRFTWRQPWGRT